MGRVAPGRKDSEPVSSDHLGTFRHSAPFSKGTTNPIFCYLYTIHAQCQPWSCMLFRGQGCQPIVSSGKYTPSLRLVQIYSNCFRCHVFSRVKNCFQQSPSALRVLSWCSYGPKLPSYTSVITNYHHPAVDTGILHRTKGEGFTCSQRVVV